MHCTQINIGCGCWIDIGRVWPVSFIVKSFSGNKRNDPGILNPNALHSYRVIEDVKVETAGGSSSRANGHVGDEFVSERPGESNPNPPYFNDLGITVAELVGEVNLGDSAGLPPSESGFYSID